jgi:D-methionine transport system ATP-binding protein
MIQIDNAAKVFKTPVSEYWGLRDVSLSIRRGEIFGIIGRSGAGKSTLLRLINHLEPPSAGRVLVDGQDPAALQAPALRRLRQRIGFVFQHFNLLNSKSVFENVRLPLRVAGNLSRAEQNARVEEALSLVGLGDQAMKFPARLSGGQRQRVGIARALVNRPDILLCDEATSALDPETTQAILQLLLDIHRRFSITIVLVTHSMGVIRALADRVAVLDRGRLMESGPVSEVFLRPRHEVTRALLEESGFEIAVHAPRGERVVGLSYAGACAGEPLLTRIAHESGLDFSILSGSVGRLKETPYGQFTVELVNASEGEFNRFISLCAKHGVHPEVMH